MRHGRAILSQGLNGFEDRRRGRTSRQNRLASARAGSTPFGLPTADGETCEYLTCPVSRDAGRGRHRPPLHRGLGLWRCLHQPNRLRRNFGATFWSFVTGSPISNSNADRPVRLGFGAEPHLIATRTGAFSKRVARTRSLPCPFFARLSGRRISPGVRLQAVLRHGIVVRLRSPNQIGQAARSVLVLKKHFRHLRFRCSRAAVLTVARGRWFNHSISDEHSRHRATQTCTSSPNRWQG
jgi:hypothetical protein